MIRADPQKSKFSLGGSIIELGKLAGEPVNVLVSRSSSPREVVVIDENFGVRVTGCLTQQRLRPQPG